MRQYDNVYGDGVYWQITHNPLPAAQVLAIRPALQKLQRFKKMHKGLRKLGYPNIHPTVLVVLLLGRAWCRANLWHTASDLVGLPLLGARSDDCMTFVASVKGTSGRNVRKRCAPPAVYEN